MTMGNLKADQRTFSLHVGLMKTGTTYIQYILEKNRSYLMDNGWNYPGPRENQQFAFYNICGKDIPWVTDRSVLNYGKIGAKLVEISQERATNLIMSSEALSSLDADGIGRLKARIGLPDKVIFTIRSLPRIFPSSWQQILKSGAAIRLDKYFADTLNEVNAEPLAGFWRSYAFGRIIQLWKTVLDVEVNVVIVPQSSARPDEFWSRFRSASGVPDVPEKHVPSQSSNASLSIELAELMYLFNRDFCPTRGLESHKKRTEFLKKCIFPAASLGWGKPILLHPDQDAMIRQWNEQECETLHEYADKIFGDLSELGSGHINHNQ